jgi:hypothetical protein
MEVIVPYTGRCLQRETRLLSAHYTRIPCIRQYINFAPQRSDDYVFLRLVAFFSGDASSRQRGSIFGFLDLFFT